MGPLNPVLMAIIAKTSLVPASATATTMDALPSIDSALVDAVSMLPRETTGLEARVTTADSGDGVEDGNTVSHVQAVDDVPRSPPYEPESLELLCATSGNEHHDYPFDGTDEDDEHPPDYEYREDYRLVARAVPRQVEEQGHAHSIPPSPSCISTWLDVGCCHLWPLDFA